MSTRLDNTYVISYDDIPAAEAEAVLDTSLVAVPETAVIELSGPGAVTCVQGLLTNDVERPGDGAFVYGAMLTNKGMIVCDMWAVRDGESVRLTAPAHGRERLLELLTRSVPPRLARTNDLSESVGVLRLAGPLALETASRSGLNIPDLGSSAWCILGASKCLVARPEESAPFSLEIQTSAADLHDVKLSLTEAGGTTGSHEALELARVLAGFPRLDAEIAEKTLPQEVRFDQIGGVSYTKGCYTGQETVARLHFRGHANRELIGLSWEENPTLADPVITQGTQDIGRVTSVAWLDPIDQHIGIGMVKRAVDRDETVIAGGSEAVLIDLPFRFDS